MNEEKFSKFSKIVLIAGVFFALYFLINTLVHTSIGSKIPAPPASRFMGPNADK